MEEGGRPFVLEESHAWLRAIAESKLRDPVVFWGKMDRLPTVKGEIPESAREALEHLLPEHGIRYRLARRRAGLGSLGRLRLVGLAGWGGGAGGRGAQALTGLGLRGGKPGRAPAECLFAALPRRGGGVPGPVWRLA